MRPQTLDLPQSQYDGAAPTTGADTGAVGGRWIERVTGTWPNTPPRGPEGRGEGQGHEEGPGLGPGPQLWSV
ncbi:hypothetical protein DKG71_20435 [Streptomyces sp. NEAU-S7GS2]|nr:hypothetical protein DKG71_20435 [Streptomyces sp. NEAU-S7GS2]